MGGQKVGLQAIHHSFSMNTPLYNSSFFYTVNEN